MPYSRLDANDGMWIRMESRQRHEHDRGENESTEEYHVSPGKSGVLDTFFRNSNGVFLFASMMTIPLLLLSALLIGIVIRYRVEPPPTSANVPRVDQHVYYMNFSATSLVLLASFSSSIVGFLATFFMNLLSYPMANRILKLSGKGNLEQLPTPHQLALMILPLYGGFGALWGWTKYLWRRNPSERIPSIAKLSILGLTAANTFGYFQ